MTTRGLIVGESLTWRIDRSTCLQVASLSEFLVARALIGDGGQCEGESYVVRSPEDGNNDLGFLIGEEGPQGLNGDSTIRFMQLIDPNVESNHIVPLDVKTIMPTAYRGGVSWRLTLTSQQVQTCQALIIMSPEEPDFAMLLPVRYLCETKEAHYFADGGAHYTFIGSRPLWTLHPIPAFPPELTPFVLPFSGLREAVGDMRDYATGSVNHWVNRYTGATFAGVPRPRAYDRSVLEPRFAAFRRAYEEIVWMYRAFDRHAGTFRITFCDIRSMLGDFKLTHRSTGEHSHVEAKAMHCKVQRTGSPSLWHAQTSLPSPDRAIFTWNAPWDYLWSHVNRYPGDSGPPQALFVPRDKIPKSWWNVPVSQERQVWLEWPADHPWAFDEFLVGRAPAARLVHDMEKILRRNPHRAQELVPMAPLALGHLTETDPETGAMRIRPTRSEAYWDSSAYRRGYGSAAHSELRGETYPEWASEVLLELCRQQGKGTVLDLGVTEVMPRYWLTHYTWSEDDKSSYDRDKKPPCPVWRLDLQTPMVPISFLRLIWYRGFQPWCTRGSEYIARAMISHPPSLIVCDLFPYTCTRLPHGRFIFPSDILPEIVYREDFTLKEGLLDQYSVDYDDVVDSILSILDGKPETTVGLCNRIVQASDYVHWLREVWRAVPQKLAVVSEDEDAITEVEQDDYEAA